METWARRRWVAVVGVVGAVVLVLMANKLTSAPPAEPVGAGIENGIMAVPVQLGRDIYGLAMVDTRGQTLWIYELNYRGATYSRLKLFAARSWRYDKLLEQYNTDEPKPEQVRMILENMGRTTGAGSGKQRIIDTNNIADIANDVNTGTGG